MGEGGVQIGQDGHVPGLVSVGRLSPDVVPTASCLVRFPNNGTRTRSWTVPASHGPPPLLPAFLPSALCEDNFTALYYDDQKKKILPAPTDTKMMIILLTPTRTFLVHMGSCFHGAHTVPQPAWPPERPLPASAALEGRRFPRCMALHQAD